MQKLALHFRVKIKPTGIFESEINGEGDLDVK